MTEWHNKNVDGTLLRNQWCVIFARWDGNYFKSFISSKQVSCNDIVVMAFIQYLTFDGVPLPMLDSYDVELTDVETDSTGETEAGTTQRDMVNLGVVHISVSFSVGQKWLKLLTGFKQ